MAASSAASESASSSRKRKQKMANVRYTHSFCGCGDEARMWTSWTESNPGRRFLGCPNFKDKQKACGFFLWVDEEMAERAKDVINSLRRENTELRDICSSGGLRKWGRDEAAVAGDLPSFVDENELMLQRAALVADKRGGGDTKFMKFMICILLCSNFFLLWVLSSLQSQK